MNHWKFQIQGNRFITDLAPKLLHIANVCTNLMHKHYTEGNGNGGQIFLRPYYNRSQSQTGWTCPLLAEW